MLSARRPVDFLHLVLRRFYQDRCMQIASSLTFTSLLAIVPMVTVALTMIAAFPVFGSLSLALQAFVLENLVPASADVISTYTQQFAANAAKLTAVGIVFLFVTTIMLLLTIDRAFNDIWRVKRPRPLVQRVLVYWTLITIGPVLIGGSLSLTSWLVGHAVGLVRAFALPGASVVVLSLVPIVLTAIALSLLYATMPNRRIRPLDALTGGIIAAVVFEITKRGFALYVAQVPTYTMVYGAFATLPIFLLWIYTSWLVVIFGAVVVATLPEWREGAGQAQPVPGSDFFDVLQILKVLWRAHAAGEVVMLPQILAAASVRIDQVENIMDATIAAGWVSRTAAGGWVLARTPTAIRVDEVYKLFVFQGDAHRPARGGDSVLESQLHELGARIDQNMRMSIDELFRTSGNDSSAVGTPVSSDALRPVRSAR